MSTAISIKGISKQYVLGSELISGQNFREMLLSSLKAPFRKFRRLRGEDREQEKFWALSNITFDVQAGEVVGIVGLNGAGKSTLLKVLSRITTPTNGEIEYQGRLASLLEVGTGFHPELTGRENIYLNGAILGMTRNEINLRMDEIVAFAEIERFLDTPVKRYSSGMYVRLAFSVAAHLDPEILIVDEVLSVGDTKFQSKCLGKMKSVAEQGRTVIFISHNLAAVSRLCDRGIWLEKGKVKMDGNIHEVIEKYENHSLHSSSKLNNGNIAENKHVVIQQVLIGANESSYSKPILPCSRCLIEISGHSISKLSNASLVAGFYDERQQRVCLLDSNATNKFLYDVDGDFKFYCNINSLHLTPGRYTINIAIKNEGQLLIVVERAVILYVEESPDTKNLSELGPLLVDFNWSEKFASE